MKLPMKLKHLNIKNYMDKLKIILLLFLFTISAYGQDSVKVSLSTNVVSRYVDHGMNMGGNCVHIQPALSASIKNLEIGVWGSYGVSNNYTEADVYAKYTFKTVAIQFMNMNSSSIEDEYGNYNTNTNMGEISLFYQSKKIPLKLIATTYVYGDNNNYSTYAEVGSPINVANIPIDLFVGMTPNKGYYGDKLAITNIGSTFHYSLKLDEKVSIPTFITLCSNPNTKNVFIIFGLTI